MSDLISRAEAIKMITSLDENVVKHSSDMKILAVERIKRLPVAYDVDKAVEELKDWTLETDLIMPFDREVVPNKKVIMTLNAIDIVRKGGVDG